MSGNTEMEERLAALEIHVAHQDETITSLNTIVTEQWHEIDRLKRRAAALAERLSMAEETLEKGAAPPHQPPPHY